MAALHILALLTALIWIYLVLARGNFWREPARSRPAPAPQFAPATATATATATRRVIAVIPARNEAGTIGATVSSLLQQRGLADLRIVVVDDGSTDGTADFARAAADALGASPRLTLITSAPLPPGWTGKLWALSQGVDAATAQPAAAAATPAAAMRGDTASAGTQPDYLLFTDADVVHEPDGIAQLVSRADSEGRDLVSLMVKLSASTLAERCLIPAFVFFFLMIYPPRWVGAAGNSTAAAAGGCMLLRPPMLAAIGGVESLRSRIIDDCALAQAVKNQGGSVWLGLTTRAHSLRRYDSFAEIGAMVSRTAFSQLRHSWLLLIATLLGLAVTYLAPPLLLLSADPSAMALGALAWALMGLAYLPMVRFYGVRPLWCISLPAVAVFYAGATLHSALQYRHGRGGFWKGRIQDSRASS